MINKIKNTIISTIVLTIFVSNFVMADTKEIALDMFTSINVMEDVNVIVKCSDIGKAVLKAKNLNEVNITNNNAKLEIEYDNGFDFFGLFRESVAEITLWTLPNYKIKEVIASKGAKIFIDKCAVADENVEVDVSMGANVEMTGNVKNINVDISMGGTFNEDNHKNLNTEIVEIDVDMGGVAYFCNVKKIKGVAKMGGTVNLNENADINIRETMGGSYDTHNYFTNCK